MVSWLKMLVTGLAGVVFFLVIDSLFIHLVMAPLYVAHYPDLLRTIDGQVQVHLGAALLCYLLMLCCLLYFVSRLKHQTPLRTVLFQGALLGVTFYGVFDFTNLAILRGWSWSVSIAEVIWGGIICSLTFTFMHWLLMRKLRYQ